MPKIVKSKLGAPKRITSLSNCIKNTPKSGQVSPPLWETAIKTNVSIDTEDSPSSESTEKYGLLNRMKPLEK